MFQWCFFDLLVPGTRASQARPRTMGRARKPHRRETGHMADSPGRGTREHFVSMDEGTSSWFMVSWPEGGKPQVVMEFWTREEAEMALELAMRVGVDSRPAADRVSTGLYPAPVLMSDPFMKEALLAWDDQLQELDSIERQIRRGG
jgi:hypothetical protein